MRRAGDGGVGEARGRERACGRAARRRDHGYPRGFSLAQVRRSGRGLVGRTNSGRSVLGRSDAKSNNYMVILSILQNFFDVRFYKVLIYVSAKEKDRKNIFYKIAPACARRAHACVVKGGSGELIFCFADLRILVRDFGDCANVCLNCTNIGYFSPNFRGFFLE